MDSFTIMVVGSGGREHALVQKCLASPLAKRVIAAPGNGGIAREAECFPVAADNLPQLVELAQSEQVDLVVVGPEVPLSLGLVDALEAVGIPAYGPRRAGAQLEASKVFCKAFLARHKIPTAAYERFAEVEPALDYLKSHPAPIVVKASGLAAGKGVIMAQSDAEAEAAVRDMLEHRTFGDSGREIVIEETLIGEEASIHVIVSGSTYLVLPPSQDHKRAGEGDAGPNTGGMGAYSPTGVITPGLMAEIEARVIRPTVDGLRADGIDFNGTLYAGLMITADGPKVLEYNVRFGDPETQVLLPLVEDDLVPVLMASAKGEPLPAQLKVMDGSAIVVVLAAGGYPGNYEKGDVISFPDSIPVDASILHAGTQLQENGDIVTSGGRVLGVTGRGATLAEASTVAYAVCDAIEWRGKYLRRDIGHRELSRAGET